MSIIIQFTIIASLLITTSLGSFIKFKEDMEYTFLIKNRQTLLEPNGVFTIRESIEQDLRLQKISNNKYYGQFYNKKYFEGYIEKDEDLGKPFLLEMNGTKIGNITFASNVTYQEHIGIHSRLKFVMSDRTDLTKFLDVDVWKNDTGIVHLPLGFCDSQIIIVHDDDIVNITAESTKEHCKFSEEMAKVLGSDRIATIEDSSTSFTRMSLKRKTMDPTELHSYLYLKMQAAEGFFIITSDMFLVPKESKVIERKVQLDSDTRMLTNEEILEALRIDVNN